MRLRTIRHPIAAQLAIAAAVAASVTIARADTYNWVNTNTAVTGWDDSDLPSPYLLNWKLSSTGAFTLDLPGPNDALRFATSTGTSRLIAHDFNVQELRFEDIDMVVDGSPFTAYSNQEINGGNVNSLALRLGKLIQTGDTRTIRFEDISVQNQARGMWAIDGNLKFGTNAVIIGEGFKKSGAGTIEIRSSTSFTSAIDIQQGTISLLPTVNNLSNFGHCVSNSINIGDGNGNVATSALVIGDGNGTAWNSSIGLSSASADIYIQGDGRLSLNSVVANTTMALNSLSLEGGSVDVASTDVHLKPNTITAKAQYIGAAWRPAAWTGRMDVPDSGMTISVDRAYFDATKNSADALHINAPVYGGVLTLNGNAETTVNRENYNAGFTLENGVLHLSSSFANTGNYVVGKNGEPSPASMYSEGHLGAPRSGVGLTVKPNGLFQDNNGQSYIDRLTMTGGTVRSDHGQSIYYTGGTVSIPVVDQTAVITSNLEYYYNPLYGIVDGAIRDVAFDVSNGTQPVDLELHGTLIPFDEKGWIKTGAGTMRLTGASPAASGYTIVKAGTLELSTDAGTNAANNLTIDAGTGAAANAAVVKLVRGSQINDSSTVTIGSGGALDLNGQIDIISNLAFTGGSTNGQVKGASGSILGVDNKISAPTGTIGTINIPIDLHDRDVELNSQSTISQPALVFNSSLLSGTASVRGGGAVQFNSVGGNAVLNVDDGTALTNSSTFAGLEGDATISNSGDLSLAPASGTTHTFSGLLNGVGTLKVSGPGTQVLAGVTDNRLDAVVSGGTLRLAKPGSHDAVTNLTVLSGGTVECDADQQFATEAAVTVAGAFKVNGKSQTFRQLTVNTGGIVAGGTLSATTGITMQGGTIDNALLSFVGSGGLVTSGNALAYVRGDVNGHSDLGSDATLRVDSAGFFSTDLRFANGLHATNGTTFQLKPTALGRGALIDVDGGLLVGQPVAFFNTLGVMIGTAQIDLSQAGSLQAGIYNLIDFSTNGFTLPGFNGSIYPTLANFTLVPPTGGVGVLAITNNVLQYVATPEPVSLGWVMVAGVGMLRRRCRPA